MDPNLWLLVEWTDCVDQNIFSNYGIVKTDSLLRHESDLHTGKVVFLHDKHNNVRKAQILRVSDNKRYVKELKVMLERQDNQVKNVLSLCVNTIKEMKTGSMFFGANQTLPIAFPGGSNTLRRDLDNTESSDSSSDQEINHDLNVTKSTIRHDNQLRGVRSQEMRFDGRMSRLLNDNSLFPKPRGLLSSTPLPDRIIAKIKTNTDKATQTEPLPSNLEQIEQIEIVLKGLYRQFLAMVTKQDDARNRVIMERVSEVREVLNYTEPEKANTLEDNRSGNVKIRRVSAQTTNVLPADDSELVPIGSGNVTIPSRILDQIDWTSHTVATRQLLQSVFPRRILATHSLTGKQSPAFANKPPKKQLDPKLVEDIVDTVSERCGVPQRIVRSSITTKCTDEAKLYRNRQRLKKMCQEQVQENIAPSSNTSSEYTNPGE